ncbi:MAG: hypothetical protein ACKO6A_01580, partial [Bacteroidota bacterium]
ERFINKPQHHNRTCEVPPTYCKHISVHYFLNFPIVFVCLRCRFTMTANVLRLGEGCDFHH